MEYDIDDRRIHWMTFIGVLIGMAIIGVFLLRMLDVIEANHATDELSRRTRIEACRTVENEITRAVCIKDS